MGTEIDRSGDCAATLIHTKQAASASVRTAMVPTRTSRVLPQRRTVGRHWGGDSGRARGRASWNRIARTSATALHHWRPCPARDELPLAGRQPPRLHPLAPKLEPTRALLPHRKCYVLRSRTYESHARTK